MEHWQAQTSVIVCSHFHCLLSKLSLESHVKWLDLEHVLVSSTSYMIALILRGLVPLKFNGVFPVLDICLMDASFSFLFDMNVLLQQLCNIDLFSNIFF